MSGESPRTAEAVLARLEEMLAGLPSEERGDFWVLLIEHPRLPRPGGILGMVKETLDKGINLLDALSNRLMDKVVDKAMNHVVAARENVLEISRARDQLESSLNEVLAKLAKHRKPRRNAARDAEIMQLHDEEKTAGQIVLAMKDRYSKLTDKIVNAVISRERRRRGY
jgi:hypothetical protein